MSELISTIIEMKRVYLDMTTDLSNLTAKLEMEIKNHPEQVTEDLILLYREATLHVTTNKVMSVGFAKIHNKLDPPLRVVVKKTKTSHLVRVK